MIQRLLYRALDQGIAYLKANPDLVSDLFRCEYLLEAAEAAGIQKLFVEQTPVPIFGFAAPDTVFPCYSIILPSERESQTYIGDDPGMIEDPDDINFGAEQHGSIWTHNYDVLVMSRHPDATAYYYEIAKMILVTAHDYFVEQGLLRVDLSGGDLAPDERYGPQFVFVRRLNVQAQREFKRTDQASKFRKAFKVTGIFVDRDGSRSDPGDVKSNVKTYVPES